MWTQTILFEIEAYFCIKIFGSALLMAKPGFYERVLDVRTELSKFDILLCL